RDDAEPPRRHPDWIDVGAGRGNGATWGRGRSYGHRFVGGSQHLGHSCGVAVPIVQVRGELASPFRRELVVLGAAVVLRPPPRCLDPALVFHAVERWVERAFLEAERVVRSVLDPPRDRESVLWPPRQSLENQELDGSVSELYDVWHVCHSEHRLSFRAL